MTKLAPTLSTASPHEGGVVEYNNRLIDHAIVNIATMRITITIQLMRIVALQFLDNLEYAIIYGWNDVGLMPRQPYFCMDFNALCTSIFSLQSLTGEAHTHTLLPFLPNVCPLLACSRPVLFPSMVEEERLTWLAWKSPLPLDLSSSFSNRAH